VINIVAHEIFIGCRLWRARPKKTLLFENRKFLFFIVYKNLNSTLTINRKQTYAVKADTTELNSWVRVPQTRHSTLGIHLFYSCKSKVWNPSFAVDTISFLAEVLWNKSR